MTQHEHGPWRDRDEHEPSGYTAAVATLLCGAALLVLFLAVIVLVGA